MHFKYDQNRVFGAKFDLEIYKSGILFFGSPGILCWECLLCSIIITRLDAAAKKTFPGRGGWLDQLGMKSTQSLLSWGLGWAWQKCHQLYHDFYEHFNLLKEGHLDWILNHNFNIWNFLNGSRPSKRIN